MVTMKVSWYDNELVMFQEEKDERMANEMSQEVDSRREVMRIEMSDLQFSELSGLEGAVL